MKLKKPKKAKKQVSEPEPTQSDIEPQVISN